MPNKVRGIIQGMTFKTWMYYVLFSLCILALLIVFQVILFEPLYRQSKMTDIKRIVNEMAENIDDDEMLQTITMDNDGCSVVVKADKTQKGIDAIGLSCLLYKDGKVNSEYVKQLKSSETGELNFIAEVNGTQEMLIYGKKFLNQKEKPYYVLFNTPLQPLQSTISMIRNQLMYLSALVLILSLFMSMYFSRKLSKPITNMTKQAKLLSTGNTNIEFEKSEFTEVNELSDALTFAAKELGQIDELRRDLIANVSHDIKTPLTMISAYAEMIRDISGSHKKKRNEHLEVILQESAYLNRLVEDMRDLSLLQAGEVRLQQGNFDLASAIHEAVYKFKTITKEQKIDLQLDIEPELIAYADRFKIQEVLYNFIGNAIKHCGEDRIIIVRAYSTGKHAIRVEVTDHGPGIEPQVLNHIWERYYKTDKSYQRAQSGTGLGLAISKAILDQHHSDYGVISEVGKGSTFYFEIEKVEL